MMGLGNDAGGCRRMNGGWSSLNYIQYVLIDIELLETHLSSGE